MYPWIRNAIRNVSLVLVLTATAALAEPTSSIARFGKPKYGPDFQNFSYLNPKAPKGGKLKMGTFGTFDTLNQYTAKGIPPVVLSMMSNSLTIDPLMVRAIDEPFTLYGLIAEKVEVAPDNSSITFFLNPKARFHDGTPITAEDVKFSYEMLREQGLPRYRQFYGKIDTIEIIDPRTIKLTFKKGDNGSYDPEIPMITAVLHVFSKARYQGKDFRETGMTPLLGSGPYRIAKAEPGRSIAYERVKDYWAADLPVNRGKYNFDIIQLDYYKNAEAQFQAFKAGEFDAFFETNTQQWQDGYNIPAVKSGKIQKFEAKHKRPVTVRMLIFNMRRPLFSDLRVRKAINLAYDWETVNKMLCNNDYYRMTSLFANTHLAHKGPATGLELEYLKPYIDTIPPEILEKGYIPPTTKGDGDARANLAEADKLLNEAGWVIETTKDPVTQQTTIRRINKETKQPLTFEIMYKDPRLEKFLGGFRQNLQQLGITLKLRFMDTVQYEARVIDSDFDMISHLWSNSLSPGNEQVYYFSQKTADQKGSSNYIGVKDPVLEALAQNVPNAKTGEEQVASVRALDRAVMGRVLFVPMFYDNTIYWAYWADRVEFPTFDPLVGTNTLEWWWSKNPTPIAATQETSTDKPSFFQRVKGWFKGLFSKA